MNFLRCSLLVLFLLVPFAEATESGIVGGRVAKAHSRPYMASLQFQEKHSCGGILIREDYVLTAAHCQRSQAMTVVLGAHNLSKKEKSQQSTLVAKYNPHPKYRGLFDYDIMLLKLEKNATLNKYVKPIGLPRKDGKIPSNIKCDVAGWGKTAADGDVSNVLKEATEKIQFSSECKHNWGNYFDSLLMICTKFVGKRGGVCQGDSGGPLICNKKPQAITAFTKEQCDDPKFPHVFTKIGPFMPWIKSVMLN